MNKTPDVPVHIVVGEMINLAQKHGYGVKDMTLICYDKETGIFTIEAKPFSNAG
jgi:hypothetical protein